MTLFRSLPSLLRSLMKPLLTLTACCLNKKWSMPSNSLAASLAQDYTAVVNTTISQYFDSSLINSTEPGRFSTQAVSLPLSLELLGARQIKVSSRSTTKVQGLEGALTRQGEGAVAKKVTLSSITLCWFSQCVMKPAKRVSSQQKARLMLREWEQPVRKEICLYRGFKCLQRIASFWPTVQSRSFMLPLVSSLAYERVYSISLTGEFCWIQSQNMFEEQVWLSTWYQKPRITSTVRLDTSASYSKWWLRMFATIESSANRSIISSSLTCFLRWSSRKQLSSLEMEAPSSLKMQAFISRMASLALVSFLSIACLIVNSFWQCLPKLVRISSPFLMLSLRGCQLGKSFESSVLSLKNMSLQTVFLFSLTIARFSLLLDKSPCLSLSQKLWCLSSSLLAGVSIIKYLDFVLENQVFSLSCMKSILWIWLPRILPCECPVTIFMLNFFARVIYQEEKPTLFLLKESPGSYCGLSGRLSSWMHVCLGFLTLKRNMLFVLLFI